MATPATNHLASPSTLGIPNSGDRVLTPSPPVSPGKLLPPSPRAHSKSILTIALQKAQSAVLLDSANNVDDALAAYKQTVRLLLQVIEKAVNEADRRRLQHIHDTYADRIRLLSTIVPNLDESEDNDEDEQQQHHDDDFSAEENETKTFTHRRSYGSAELNGRSLSSQINSIVAESNVRETEDGISASDAEEQGSKQVNTGNKFGEEDATLSNIDKTPKDEEDADISNLSRVDDVINNTTYHSYQKSEISDRNKNDRESTKSAHSERKKHKSSPSTSSTKSWSSRKSRTSDKTTPPASDYESATERRKSAMKSTKTAEFLTGSDDIGPYATNDLNNPDSQEEVSQFDPNLTAEDESSLATSTASSKDKRSTPRTSLTSPYSQLDNSGISNSTSSLNSPFSSPRPPSKSADKRHKRKGSSSASHVPKSSVSSIASTSSTLTIQKPSTGLSHEHEDNSSIISTHTSSVSISSTTGPTPSSVIPVDQTLVEKMTGKVPSHGKQPSLTSIQENNYDSRKTSVARSPSDPPVLADTPATGSNGSTTPRRAISNPGQLRKNGTIRPLQNNSPTGLPGWNQTPGSPNSPWMSGFNSPTSTSPVFSPGIHRSDSISAKLYDASYSSMVDSNSLMFDDDTLNDPGQEGIPELPPTDVHMRPFWLMRILERTMTTGGYLTKKLFVPSNMWIQANVKLTAVEAKLSSCDVIYNCLSRLERTTVDDLDGLVKELDSIEMLFDGIQNTLARKLNYVETTSGKSRQSTSLMSWGSKLSQRLDRMGMGNVANRSEEANSYVEILLKVFQAAYVVEGHIRHFSSLKAPYHHHHTHIVSRLYKMADFFGNVVCRFVVRDLGILADKYVKRGGSWFID